MKSPLSGNTRSLVSELILSICILLCLAMPSLYAQETGAIEYLKTIPPESNAAALGKYGDIAVSHYTGIPDVNIPLYTLREKDIELPITLNYFAGGIKVNEQASWVGLGWSLGAGGMITRIKQGEADEYGSDCSNTFEPDIFYFNFMGVAGKFFIKPSHTPGAITCDDIMLISQKKMKICPVDGNSSPDFDFGFDGFVVTLENGFVCTFMGAHELIKETGKSKTIGRNGEEKSLGEKKYIGTWYLTKVTSPGGGLISFEYSEPVVIKDTHTQTLWWEQTHFSKSNPLDVISSDDLKYCYRPSVNFELGIRFGTPAEDSGGNDPMFPDQMIQTTNVNYDQRYLTRIVSGNFSIDLVTANRTDLEPFTPGILAQRLSQILIKDKNSSLIKKMEFVNDAYFDSGSNNWHTKRLKLLELKTWDNNLGNSLSHQFVYHSKNLPKKDSDAVDYWGYFNGKGTNNNVVPHEEDRAVDPEFVPAGSLYKIIYPTKGYTVFEFESNRYFSETRQEEVVGGGLRIRSIKNYDFSRYNFEEKLISERHYEYVQEISSGIFKTSGKQLAHQVFIYSFPHSATISFPVPKRSLPNCGFIEGEEQRFHVSFNSRFNVYSSYNYVPQSPASSSNNAVGYSKVTEYLNDLENSNSESNGKIEYEYENETPFKSNYWLAFEPLIVPHVASLRNGLIKKIVTYKKTPTGYSPQITRQFSFISKHNTSLFVPSIGKKIYSGSGCDIDVIINIKIQSDWLVNDQEIVVEDREGTNLTQTLNYKYDDLNHMQLTDQKATRSDGREEIVQYTYPMDFNTSSINLSDPKTVTLKNMQNLHMMNSVVSKINIVKDPVSGISTVQGGEIYTYKTSPNQQNSQAPYIHPDVTYQLETTLSQPISGVGFSPASMQGGTFQPEAHFAPYYTQKFDEFGNMIEVKHITNYFKSYLWGYNNSFIVAETENAAKESVFYAGFEDDGTVGESASGDRYYAGSSYTIPGAQVPIGSDLRISYWYYDGTWKFKSEQAYSSPTISEAGALRYDEVRVFPRGALMKTFTHRPGFGVTSIMDANNIRTFYEYDSFGRLEFIKDDRKDIVKRYHYEIMKR